MGFFRFIPKYYVILNLLLLDYHLIFNLKYLSLYLNHFFIFLYIIYVETYQINKMLIYYNGQKNITFFYLLSFF